MTRKQNAFTLIELLVVISIIALLISILLPALRSAREAAMMVKCLSNQRSTALSINMYYSDFKDFIPFQRSNVAGDTSVNWMQRLVRGGLAPKLTDDTWNVKVNSSQLSNTRFCPMLADRNPWTTIAPGGETISHFNMSEAIAPDWTGTQWQPWELPPLPAGITLQPRRSTSILKATQTMLLGEAYLRDQPNNYIVTTSVRMGGSTSNIYRWRIAANNPVSGTYVVATKWRHRDKSANFQFIDGHGETRSYDAGNYGGWGKLAETD